MKLKTLIIIVLLLAASLGVAYYLGYTHGYEKAVWVLKTQEETSPNENEEPVTVEPNIYRNGPYGFSIQYPDNIPPRLSFEGSYLLPETWSIYAPASSTGEKIVSFAVPNSNSITAGVLRIGVSNDPTQVTSCTQSPEFANFSVATTTINGTVFTIISGSDAAMSHFSSVKSYRTVHKDRCYVIDTFVYGTNPEVYDPPTTSPFSVEQGFAVIDPIVYTFKFE